MIRFQEYKEQAVYEGLLRDILVKVKDGVSYYVSKLSKAILSVISPQVADGYNKGGIRVATISKMPDVNEEPVSVGEEENVPEEKRNIKAFIKLASSAPIDEAAVHGFGDYDATTDTYVKRERETGKALTNFIQDIDVDMVQSFILPNIIKTSKRKGHARPVCLFGAPGIGKTSMVKQVVDAYNAGLGEGDAKKGLIVINCANLGLDSLSLTMPTSTTNKAAIAKAAGVDKTEADINANMGTVIADAPKEWLPCYRPTGDPEEDAKLDAIANGHISTKGITTDGGIIFLDELLRVKSPSVFGQLMELLLERTLGEYVIGSKWTFVCASNRPNDDNDVRNALNGAPSAFFNRFAGVYHVNPDVRAWLRWARKGNAHPEIANRESWRVDPRICDFIETAPNFLSNIEYNDMNAGELVGATPRSWDTLSQELWDIVDNDDLNDWKEVDNRILSTVIQGNIGREAYRAFMDFLQGAASNTEGIDETCMQAYQSVADLKGTSDEDKEAAKKVIRRAVAAFEDVKQVMAVVNLIKSNPAPLTPYVKAFLKALAKQFPDANSTIAGALEK